MGSSAVAKAIECMKLAELLRLRGQIAAAILKKRKNAARPLAKRGRGNGSPSQKAKRASGKRTRGPRRNGRRLQQWQMRRPSLIR